MRCSRTSTRSAAMALLAVLAAAAAPRPAAAAPVPAAAPEENAAPAGSARAQKQLPYFSYLPPQFALPPQLFGYAGPQDGDSNEVSSRAEPAPVSGARKPAPFPDSPVYYIRMPPTPYVFVPGLGYVSQPPAQAFSPFINLPVDFVANGKPTNVYWRPAPAPAPLPPPPPRPQADSSLTQLDQGPYVFNGRPGDPYLLRNTYNALYNDALQNIYP